MKLLIEKYANKRASRQNAVNLWRSTGSRLNASVRVCHTPKPNESAKSAKKQPVSSSHSAREARRSGDANPLPAAFAARTSGATSRSLARGADPRFALEGCGAGLGVSGSIVTVGARPVDGTGVDAVAASTASKAVRAARRAPLPSTRPSRSRSMQPVYFEALAVKPALCASSRRS